MPRCYMVKKCVHRHEGPPPCSPTEASVAPPCYSPAEHSALTETRSNEYAELGVPLSERSAADTEAAHELLSLAHSLPPLPPAQVVTVLSPSEPAAPLTPLLPVYTYTLQPTNIYILAEEPPEAGYHTVQTVTPLQPVEFVDTQISYVDYQPGPPPPPAPQQTEYRIEYKEVSPEREAEPQVTELQVAKPRGVEPQVAESQEAEPPVVKPPVAKPPVTKPPVTKRVAKPRACEPLPPVTKEKPGKYDCIECGKRYATSSNLSRHKQTHRSLDSVSAKRCGECGKAYVSMPALAMHVLTHRMGHVCGVCGKQFSRPWLLRGHLRSHTGEKPYNCQSCGKAFADRSNLRAHLQTHSVDKKHECTRCGKSFALKSYLSKHQEVACARSDEEDDEDE